MTDRQLQSAVRQYRGSLPAERAEYLQRLNDAASNGATREVRETAFSLLQKLVEVEKSLQADAARVEKLERSVAELFQKFEAGQTVGLQSSEPVLYSQQFHMAAWVRGGLVVGGTCGAIAYIGLSTLATGAIVIFAVALLASGLMSGSGRGEVERVEPERERTPTGGAGMVVNIYDNHGTVNITQNNGQ